MRTHKGPVTIELRLMDTSRPRSRSKGCETTSQRTWRGFGLGAKGPTGQRADGYRSVGSVLVTIRISPAPSSSGRLHLVTDSAVVSPTPLPLSCMCERVL